MPLGFQVAHEHLVAAFEVPDPGRVAGVGLRKEKNSSGYQSEDGLSATLVGTHNC